MSAEIRAKSVVHSPDWTAWRRGTEMAILSTGGYHGEQAPSLHARVQGPGRFGAADPTASAAALCRVHQIRDSLLYRWKQEFLDRAPRVF